ncbi:MAG: 1-deoxy-D-xylulose-5-phosphate synthase [Lachnospiraceae bacterium]|nr:1-deoxy-D-xylulose-5-phosphate synthase [Lachnospiraceae bacterium]
MLLENIKSTGDIKKLSLDQLDKLADELREFIIEKTSEHGGHLASNLGVVELTIALHYVLDLPEDKIVWDVGHQSYAHKILTGRMNDFDTLRQYKGLSGFPKTRESKCDAFNTGHSSTSISAGIGLVEAARLLGRKSTVVSVIGDGALSGGMAYEALNNASKLDRNFIIILNDNNMSISESTGGLSKYLTDIRTAPKYNDLKSEVTKSLKKLPVVGDSIKESISRTKMGIKQLVVPGMFFENLDITYVGPYDGHNIQKLIKVLSEVKKFNKPIVVHIHTKKGCGYEPAEKYPTRFHGIEPFDIKTGIPIKKKEFISWTDAFSHTILNLAEADKRIVAITAAMPEGTGLKKFATTYPDRFFDVGIAEEHAVTFAAGMAQGGLKPVVAIYSSFFQRAYDQIVHDVCLQNLPVVFAVDRAGIVGRDGETHQGIFDLTFFGTLPNMTVMAPKNKYELRNMLKYAFRLNSPVAIRYPRGTAYSGLKEYDSPIEYGKSEIICEGRDIAIIAVGNMIETALEVREQLRENGFEATLVNARFVKPFDTQMLDRLSLNHHIFVTIEENILAGGFGERVTEYVSQKHLGVNMMNFAIEDTFVEHGDVNSLRRMLGLDAPSITQRILSECARLDEDMDNPF